MILEKTFFDFFSHFLKHFLKGFGLFLKGLSEKIHKKSIFSKRKPSIKNRLDRSLDMVMFLNSLALLALKLRTEGQVRF